MHKKYLTIRISVQDGYKIVENVPKEFPRFWKKSNINNGWFNEFQKKFIDRIEAKNE